MGIQGLLPLLRSIHKPTHLRNFAGQTLGVDAYGWLHRGTIACAIDLAEGRPTRKHIDFALSRVRMLLHFGIKPYIVFDGANLPSKSHTESERAVRRAESKREGLELLRMGRASQAHLVLQKAVDVTPSMARELIEELKGLGVPYVVAPFEADSQLAYLEKRGVISGVLSEDSDLLVFGVQCLLTKLDQFGECVMVNRADFTACRDISLVGWTDKEFRMMAMLSGCDYLPGITNMGLKTAYRLVRKHKAVDRVIRSVQFDGKMKVPPKYIEAFTQAERTFLYQWVFCSEKQGLVNLNTVPASINIDDMPYLGKQVEADLAIGVALGNLDPNTKLPLQFNTRESRALHRRQGIQTPGEKPGKPIDEFFKPLRQPLAELDPNSFTPSPSQTRLLQNQQGASWSASQVQPLRPEALDRVAAANRRSSAPGSRIGGPPSQITAPKRRLCSDTVLAASMGGEVGMKSATSRFFTAQPPQPSPSIRKPSRKDQFEILSDDAIEEAAAVMDAEVEAAKKSPSPKRRKRMQVYADVEDVSPSAETSQTTVATTFTNASQDRLIETPGTSFEGGASQSQESVFTEGINANFAALNSAFLFNGGITKSKIPRAKTMPTVSRTPLQAAERNQILGRLAKPGKVVAVPQSPTHLDKEVVVPASSPLAQTPTHKDGGVDAEWLAVEEDRVSTNTFHGSEDLLIPNSPESAEEDTRMKAKLEFSRFAFAG